MFYLGESGQFPYLCNSEIAKQAADLLDECWDGVFPIDIEAICDYLGVSVLPVSGLVNIFHADAFISSDFKKIYVDQQEYLENSCRYRFSLAHELGHLLLHKEYFSSRVENYEEWQGLAQGADNSYVEYQANYFAGSLLAPEDQLIRIMDTEFGGSFARNFLGKSHNEFRAILCDVRRFFMVSDQVVARRMRDVFLGAEMFDEVAEVIR